MNLKKSLFSALILFSGYFSNAQSNNGEALLILQYSNQEIGVIQNHQTGQFFKTSPYTSGQISTGQFVDIIDIGDLGGEYQLVHSSFTESIFANLITDNPTGPSSELISFLPVEEDGILRFSSQEHLFQVYDLMDAYLSEGGENGLEIEDKLDVIQNNFAGFESYRNFSDQKFDLIEGSFTISEIDRIETLEHVNYEVLKTFLNKYRFIGIGDKTLYYHGEDFIIEFDETDADMLLYLQNIAISIGDLNNHGIELVNLAGRKEIVLHSDGIQVLTGNQEKGSIYDQGSGVGYYTTYDTYNEDDVCYPLKKGLSLKVNKYFGLSGASSTPYSLFQNGATLTVNWGDGTTTTHANYDETQKIYHTYLYEGEFHPSTELQFYDAGGNLKVIQDGPGAQNNSVINITFIASVECSTGDGAKTAQATGGDWMMSTKIWVSHNLLGTHVGSYTHAWKKGNTAGTWNRRSARIHTSIDGTFRNDNCDVVENKTESKMHNNDRRIQALKTKIFQKHKKLFDFDVKSTHSLEKDGTYINLDMVLSGC